MKALSVREPWASLIASGAKTIETRTRRTNYGGPVLIVASRKPITPTSGLALCVAHIVGCRLLTEADRTAAQLPQSWPIEGRWAWILSNVTRIAPFPVRGQLGLYDVDIDAQQFSAR